MTHFEDLSGKVIVKVGWLDAPHSYPTGEVAGEDIQAMERLVVHTWLPPYRAMGWHDCTLCPRAPTDGPIVREIEGQARMLGATEIWVPDGDVMYSVPTLILHYIEDHQYLPPEVFIKALRKIDPGSPEYLSECDRIWNSHMSR
jgi:hypothetical protein